ncbi:hypothetical protein Thi970DRAFT_02872 [Thiorhodovibrio frisius]|uniref:Uncharacterized protein n=1 Tax=Thiorhodovibrio frisius TaxID=631362 RepID=H8Z1X1_9GAMM|nr:hypothetical protein Thi970DRAFT_02872 [Thiorhodovibrio frisius]WPL20040.1 hypothetical protein Thiofri_00091 [Thiorhodovibrio frisius]
MPMDANDFQKRAAPLVLSYQSHNKQLMWLYSCV